MVASHDTTRVHRCARALDASPRVQHPATNSERVHHQAGGQVLALEKCATHGAGQALHGGVASVFVLPVRTNALLASLPSAALAEVGPLLELVELSLGKVLHEPGTSSSFAYFPVTAIVSLQVMTMNGDCMECAIVGNEGLVGVALFMGGHTTPSHAVVQSPGTAYRIRAEHLAMLFNRGGPLMRLFLRYTQALLTQMSQTAACNRHHSVAQQLCRLLLLCQDRLAGSELAMTQELLATMMGVRRESITTAALKLQVDGTIVYQRGHITILDRAMLETASCECYAVVKEEYDRLLPDEVAA